MDFYGPLSTFVEFLWTFMDFYGLLWTFKRILEKFNFWPKNDAVSLKAEMQGLVGRTNTRTDARTIEQTNLLSFAKAKTTICQKFL